MLADLLSYSFRHLFCCQVSLILIGLISKCCRCRHMSLKLFFLPLLLLLGLHLGLLLLLRDDNPLGQPPILQPIMRRHHLLPLLPHHLLLKRQQIPLFELPIILPELLFLPLLLRLLIPLLLLHPHSLVLLTHLPPRPNILKRIDHNLHLLDVGWLEGAIRRIRIDTLHRHQIEHGVADDFAEDCVLFVEVGALAEGYEELGGVGVAAEVGHRD